MNEARDVHWWCFFLRYKKTIKKIKKLLQKVMIYYQVKEHSAYIVECKHCMQTIYMQNILRLEKKSSLFSDNFCEYCIFMLSFCVVEVIHENLLFYTRL